MAPLYVVGIYIWKLNCLLEGLSSKYLLENFLHVGAAGYLEGDRAEPGPVSPPQLENRLIL